MGHQSLGEGESDTIRNIVALLDYECIPKGLVVAKTLVTTDSTKILIKIMNIKDRESNSFVCSRWNHIIYA